MSLPDPKPDQPKQNKTAKVKGKATAKARGRRKGKRIRFFAGSLEPLSAARKRRRYNKLRRGSLLNTDRDPNAGDDVAEDEHRDEGAEVDVEADENPDDDGVWPGEYIPVFYSISYKSLGWVHAQRPVPFHLHILCPNPTCLRNPTR